MHDLTTPQVSLHHNRPVTTSLNVAGVFGKQHNNVIRTIRDMDIPCEFSRLNFEQREYKDSRGHTQPLFELTRDGFTLLAMGFTGKVAMQFKVKYIEAFNAMESQLLQAPTQVVALEQQLAKALLKESELRQAPAQVVALKQQLAKALLKQRPDWKAIKRYKGCGLFHREIAKLLDIEVTTVRKHVRAMEACGLLTPPANLATLQQGVLRLHPEVAHV